MAFQAAQAPMPFVRHVSRFGLWFGGALILAAACLIGIDIVLRKTLGMSIGGADEVAGNALAIGAAWSLSSALLDRCHIRIDALYALLPRSFRLALDFTSLAWLTGFFGLIAWHACAVVYQSFSAGSRGQSSLEIPLFIPQLAWMLGLVAFVATGVILFVHCARLVFGGSLQQASRAIGTRSADEEVVAELRNLQAGAPVRLPMSE